MTLMGMWFARGMAYIITLTSLTIKDESYRTLALTKIYIPFFDKAYVYFPALIGPALLSLFFTSQNLRASGARSMPSVIMNNLLD